MHITTNIMSLNPAQYNWNIAEKGVEQHNPYPTYILPLTV